MLLPFAPLALALMTAPRAMQPTVQQPVAQPVVHRVDLRMLATLGAPAQAAERARRMDDRMPFGAPAAALERARRLQRLQTRRLDTSGVRDSAVGLFGGDPSAALPYVLVLLLAISNLLQVSSLIEQVKFLETTDGMYGAEFSRLLVDDVLSGDEFLSGLSDVVYQSLGEIFLAPMLVRLFEVVLNAVLAQTGGRRFIPLLIVTEAFGEVVGELAGQGIGSSVAESLRPASEAILAMLGVLSG